MNDIFKISEYILFIILLLMNNAISQIPASLKLILSQKIHTSPVFSVAVYNDSVLFSTSLKNEIKTYFPQTEATREISSFDISPAETGYNQFAPSVLIIKNNLLVTWHKKIDIYNPKNLSKIYSETSDLPFIFSQTIIKQESGKTIKYYHENDFKNSNISSSKIIVGSAIGNRISAIIQHGMNKIYFLNSQTGSFITSIDLPDKLNYTHIAKICLTRNDKYLVIGAYNSKIYLLELEKILVHSSDFQPVVFDARVVSPFSFTLTENLSTLVFLDKNQTINFVYLNTLIPYKRIFKINKPEKTEFFSCLALSPDSRFLLLGDYLGFLHLFKLDYGKPQILITHETSTLSGNDISIQIAQDEFYLNGYILSDIPISNVKIGETPATFKPLSDTLTPDGKLIYTFSYPLQLKQIESKEQKNIITISAQDIDGNSAILNLKIHRLVSSPEIIALTEPLPESIQKNILELETDSDTISITGYICADAPVQDAYLNDLKIKIERISEPIFKVKRNYIYRFNERIKTTKDQVTTIEIKTSDIFGNSSSKSMEIKLKTPKILPQITVSKASVLTEETEQEDEYLLYAEIEGNVKSSNRISKILVYDSIEIKFYQRPIKGNLYIADFSFFINYDELLENASSKYVKLTAIDQDGNFNSTMIYFPSSLEYILSEKFTKVTCPTVNGLFLGISYYNIKALNYPTSSNDAQAIKSAISKFSNTNPDNLITLINEQVSRTEILNSISQIISNSNEGDVIILFFSGYIISKGENLYLFTTSSSPDKLDETAVNIKNILDVVTYSQDKNFILMFDINPATEKIDKFFGPSFPVTYKNTVAKLSDLVKNIPNSIIISSVSEGQKSLFGKNFANHSLFSYSVLQALSGVADNDANGIIYLDEFLNFVYDNVKNLSNSKQICKIQYKTNMNIPLFSMRKISGR